MVLRFLIRYLAHNEKLIQMLADSYPMRKAARFTARMIMQAKYYQEGVIKNLKGSADKSVKEYPKLEVTDLAHILKDKLQKLKRIFEEQRRR